MRRARILVLMTAAALTAGCGEGPPADVPGEGKVLTMQPLAVEQNNRVTAGTCDYSWLQVAGLVDGRLTSVFLPFRKNNGDDPRCYPAIASQVAALLSAEIADGDRESVSFCVSPFPDFDADLVVAPGAHYEATELKLAGWHFRKRFFRGCDTEPDCTPPPPCDM